MGYNGLTNLGVEYLARMIAENKPVTFTKIKVGNGSIPGSQTGASTTNLYSFKKDVEILSKNQIENSIKLQVLLNNLDLEVGFYVKELGVYVQDGEQEKLYWYINKDNPSYLPDKNTPSTHRYNLFLEVSNFETNIINFTGEGLLADKKFVEDSINEAFSNFEEEYHETINTLLPKGTVPASLNTAEKIASALQANTGIKFDPDLLYLNYEGTKKVGYCYLDELADGIYECIKETSTTVNDSACFKNISNKNNSDRLDNLSNFYYDYLSGPSYQIHCRKINRVVSIDIDISGKTLKEVLSSIIIKEPFRPTFYKSTVPLVSWSSSNTYGMLELHSNGTFTSYLWENNSLVTWHLTLTFIN